MRTKAEIEGILRDVKTRLDAKRRATGIDLCVPDDGYLEDDDWLNVIVSPAAEGIRAHQYVDTLSEVEKDMRKVGIDKVLLVPALDE